LLDPQRPSEPPAVPRSTVLGKDEEAQAPAIRKEGYFASDISVREAKSRSKVLALEPEVRPRKRRLYRRDQRVGNRRRSLLLNLKSLEG